jgi:uncharacterized protein DUF1266
MTVRVLSFALCIALPVAAEHTEAQQKWALGAGAMLAELGERRHDILAGAEPSPEFAESRRETLQEVWGVTSRQDLRARVQALLSDDGDAARIGWNYPRAINIVRWAYVAGYLQQDEAWSLVFPAAERLQKTFSSWQQMGQVYLDARAKWYSNRLADRRQADYAYSRLLADQDSPWRKLPWNLDLGNGYHAPPSIDKTAWLELAAHPGGLICVRITVPDHRDSVEYETAIEDSVGCRPQITGKKQVGTDWVLDTECLQPNTVHGTQVVAKFRLEPIAELLRGEGVTQLFTTFEHQPNGSASQLFPPADDGWINNGWQWYFTVRSLRRKLPDTTIIYGVPPEEVRIFQAGAIIFTMLSLAAAYVLRGRASGWTQGFPLLFWGSWIVLSVSFQGLAIAGFWSGGEALGADVRALVWYGTLAFSLRWATEAIITAGALRPIVPRAAFGPILYMSLSRVMTEAPMAMVLVLLCDPQRPINLATSIALVALGAAVVFTAWNIRIRAEGVRGGRARGGELYDAIEAMAKRMAVPLRRIYILPEDLSPRLAPKAGSRGDLLIPERLVRSAYRRELDGIVAYQLMLIKTKYLNSVWMGVLPIMAILIWRIYNAQHAQSSSIVMIIQAGVVVSAITTFRQTLRRVHSKAQAAFKASGGDAEGWIAGLARMAALAGTVVTPGVAEQIAEQCAVPPGRIPELVTKGFPETGHYSTPDFDRRRLVSVS